MEGMLGRLLVDDEDERRCISFSQSRFEASRSTFGRKEIEFEWLVELVEVVGRLDAFWAAITAAKLSTVDFTPSNAVSILEEKVLMAVVSSWILLLSCVMELTCLLLF
jgi:hypothetical protein